MRQKPVQQNDDGEKNQKFQGIEAQIIVPLSSITAINLS